MFGKGGFESTLMNKKRSALGLALLLGVTVGLSACNYPTETTDGSVLTYTDAQGNRVSYTAEQLLDDYLGSGSSLSTEFDRVYEVLVRNYYNDPSQASVLKTLEDKARADVITDKQTATSNASSNGTSFEQEWQTILNSHDCDNADELYQYHLYQEEQSRFLDDFYATFGTGNSSINGTEVMRDGELTIDGETRAAFPASEEWGRGDAGYLKEQMPYHIRHILIKLTSATSGNFTQDTITETGENGGGEATNLATLILRWAGVNERLQTLTNRPTFSQLAAQFSGDTGSAANGGELSTDSSTGLMTKVMESDLVNEFKLGIYAYESLYNQREKATAYGSENVYRITPGLTEDATSTADVDATQTLSNDKTVHEFFVEEGIGTIPFGAALALLETSDVDTDVNGNKVNDNNAAFYPRNIIFNKYFNKHNVCVITPNAIEMNTLSQIATTIGSNDIVTAGQSAANTVAGNYVTGENYEGAHSDFFASLPGFQVDTTDILPGINGGKNDNVLTNSEGQVVLVVRAGTDSYQGVHFIVINRSALSKYGLSAQTNEGKTEYVENTEQTNGTATLNQYYTTYTTSSSSYPKDSEGNNLQTFVTYQGTQTSTQNTRSSNLVSEIRGYNKNLTSFQFQSLVDGTSSSDGAKIEFADAGVQKNLETYVRTSRQSTTDDNFDTWKNNWLTYAELLQAQEEARSLGSSTMTGTLISEHCAVQYGQADKDATWTNNGACYYDAN